MASHMNFAICNFEDFLSISSQDTLLPDIQLDLPFIDNMPFNCNDSRISTPFEMPSMFPLYPLDTMDIKVTPALKPTDYTSVPRGFMAILVLEFLFIVSLWMAISLWHKVKWCSISLWTSIQKYLMLYLTQIRQYFTTGYTLTFVGIKPPSDCGISTHSMFDRIDTTKTIQTVNTKLDATNTILDLKDTIRATYRIPNEMDILVIFAHHIISNNKFTLNECGIMDRSLLTLALCPSGKVEEEASHFNGYTLEVPVSVIRSVVSDDGENVEFDPNEMNAVFEMYSDDTDSDTDSEDENGDEMKYENSNEDSDADSDTDSDDDSEHELNDKSDPNGPRMGFDVVMQEDNVTVYRMPKCGHVMNPESLYHYALSTYSDKNNLSIKCPHFYESNGHRVPCTTKWDYHDILSVLRREGGDYDYHKLELLASRNRVQDSCNVQKCPRCHTLYFQNDSTAPNLGEIDTKEDVERLFKFECTYCSFVCRKWKPYYAPKQVTPQPVVQPVLRMHPYPPHIEDEVEELVDGNAVNAMFHNDSDSESESESDSESDMESDGEMEVDVDSDEEEEMEIIQRIQTMFDTEDDEEEHENLYWNVLIRCVEMLYSVYQCTRNMVAKMYTFMALQMVSVYTYSTTKTLDEMVEDMTSIMENADKFLYDTYHSVKVSMTLMANSLVTLKEKVYTKVLGVYTRMKVMTLTRSATKDELDTEPVVGHERSNAMDFKMMKVPTGPRMFVRRRAGIQTDLSDGGIFSSLLNSDSDSSDSEQEISDSEGEDGYIEYIEYDLDSDSEAEEEERIYRIQRLFDDDGISDPEEGDEREEKVPSGYTQETTVENAFCWGCGVEWEEGHVCDSSFKQDLCDILAMAEKKTIGEQRDIPSIRCCPHCQMLITHTQACKHMDCRNCKKAFCFVCLKPRLDSGWQCGSYSSKCPGGAAPVQGMDALPDAIVITKNAFRLY